MKDEEHFSIDGLCDVEFHSQGSPRIVSRALLRADVEYNALVPHWTMQAVPYLPDTDPDRRVIRVEEVPDFEEPFAQPMYFQWLLRMLHEVGHARNRFSYTDGWFMTRERFSTANRRCSLQDVNEVLEDEMGAWSFALDVVDLLGPSFRSQATAEVTQGFERYLWVALNPTKMYHVRGQTPRSYAHAVIGLYQKWIDSIGGSLDVEALKAQVVERHDAQFVHPLEL